MKIVGIMEDGKKVEFAELNCIDSECDLLLAKLNVMFKPEDIKNIEKELTEKTGKKVVCLQPFIEEVLCLK